MLGISKIIISKRPLVQATKLLHTNGIPFKKPNRPINFIGPIVFGMVTSTGIFFTAAFIHEKEKETLWQRLKKRTDGPQWSTIRDIITDEKLFQADLWHEKKKMFLEKKQILMKDLKDKLEKYNSIPVEIKRLFLSVVQMYLSQSDAEKTMTGLIGMNLLIFCAWRLPALKPVMNRYFTHNPASGSYATLLTSIFSHRDILHLTINMVGLWSFGPMIHDVLGREQFIATYLSLGIGSNVISHVLSLALQRSRPFISSMGASGAIYGLLSGAAYTHPDSSVFIPFLPTVPISITYLFPISITTAGVLMMWNKFNYFAHLGGASLGLLYMQLGPTYVWPTMLKTVRQLKKNSKGNGNGDGTSGVLMEIPKRIRLKLLGKKANVTEEQH